MIPPADTLLGKFLNIGADLLIIYYFELSYCWDKMLTMIGSIPILGSWLGLDKRRNELDILAKLWLEDFLKLSGRWKFLLRNHGEDLSSTLDGQAISASDEGWWSDLIEKELNEIRERRTGLFGEPWNDGDGGDGIGVEEAFVDMRIPSLQPPEQPTGAMEISDVIPEPWLLVSDLEDGERSLNEVMEEAELSLGRKMRVKDLRMPPPPGRARERKFEADENGEMAELPHLNLQFGNTPIQIEIPSVAGLKQRIHRIIWGVGNS